MREEADEDSGTYRQPIETQKPLRTDNTSGNATGNVFFNFDVGAETQHTNAINHFQDEHRIKVSRRDESPRRNTGTTKENGTNSQSYFTTINDFESIPTAPGNLIPAGFPHQNGAQTERPLAQQYSNRYLKQSMNKDTIITTSSNILSERTLNLKKEIVNLDEEIIQLQNSL